MVETGDAPRFARGSKVAADGLHIDQCPDRCEGTGTVAGAFLFTSRRMAPGGQSPFLRT